MVGYIHTPTKITYNKAIQHGAKKKTEIGIRRVKNRKRGKEIVTEGEYKHKEIG